MGVQRGETPGTRRKQLLQRQAAGGGGGSGSCLQRAAASLAAQWRRMDALEACATRQGRQVRRGKEQRRAGSLGSELQGQRC